MNRLMVILCGLLLTSAAPFAHAQETPGPDEVSGPAAGVGGPPASLPTMTSRNWAGYIATGGQFTTVDGTWKVPAAASVSVPTAISTWVGVGGVGVSDLLEAGTVVRIASTGQVSYNAWVELLPAAEQTVALAVHPDDEVNVEIAQQATGTWRIAFSNHTTGQTYEQTVQYASSLSSAEWIEGLASIGQPGTNLVPFDAFAPVTFSDGNATRDGQRLGIRDVATSGVALVGNNKELLATPLAFDAWGTGFTITRSQPPAPPPASPTRTGPLFQGTPDAIMVQPGEVGSGWTTVETRQDPPNQYSSGRRWVTLAQGGSSAGGPVLKVEVEVFRDVPTAVAGWLQRQDPLAGQPIGACDADWLWVRSDSVQLHCREANVEILMVGPTADADNAALAAMLRRIKPAPGA